MTMLRRIQFTTVAIHTAVLLWLVYWFIFVSNPYDHMLGFAWFAILGWPDLPASAAYLLLGQLLPESLMSFLKDLFRGYPHPFGNFGGFWVPLLLYGMIGTWWWWVIPAVIAWIGKRLQAIWWAA